MSPGVARRQGLCFGYALNGSSGSCYYEVGGEKVNCGNCFDGASITNCAQQAIALCDMRAENSSVS